MNLLIDIDNTLTTSLPTMIQYCKRYNDEVVRRNLQMNPIGFNESTLFNWTTEEKQAFCDRYLEEICSNVPVKEGATEVTQQLRADGHRIFIATARKKPNFSDPRGLTEDYLKRHGIGYDELFVGCEDKLQFCLEHGIEMSADDEPQNIQPISRIMPVVVFRGAQNEHCEGENVIKVNSWSELYRAVELHKTGIKFYPGMDIKQFSDSTDLSDIAIPNKSGLADVLGDVHIRRSQLDKATRYVKEEIQGTKETSKETQEEK